LATNRFVDVAGELKDADLREIEAALKIQIPEEVKQHYLAQNGGIPERPCWDLDSGEQLCISQFLPIKYPTSDNRTLESTFQKAAARDLLLPGLVPFAKDWGGNYVCFDSAGQIYFYAMDNWRPERSMEENKKAAAQFLASSMKEFVEQLVPEA
jgi:hypothetical protein